jgi:hypothetical protein
VSLYLIEAGYTSESFAALVKTPHDRIEQLRPVVARLGGSIETAYFTFGDSDLIVIVDLPGQRVRRRPLDGGVGSRWRPAASHDAIAHDGRKHPSDGEGERRRLPATV